MAVGLIIIPITIYLYYNNYVNLSTIIITTLFCYWLPKFFFVQILEYLYPIILTRNPIKQQIALTFDDVPYSYLITEQLIDLLDKYDVKCTLFIISSYVNEKSRPILIKAVQNGHQLGNHGKTDSMHWILSNEDLKMEIEHCDELIRLIYSKADVALPKQMVYRPGSGLFHDWMINRVHKMGYKLALGSVLVADPVIISSTINYYYLIHHIEKGDVIIMHDRSWTIPMLEGLLPYLQQNQFQSVTLDTLFSS